MCSMENYTTQSMLGSTIANDDILLPSSKMQNYIGVWLDDNCNQEGYAPIKKSLCDIFNSLEIFTDYSICITYINMPRPGKIFFLVSHEIGQNLIPLMLRQATSPVEYIYVYCTNESEENDWDSQKSARLRGGFTTVQKLTEQINNDIVAFDKRMERTIHTATPSISPPATITAALNLAKTTTASNNKLTHHCDRYIIPPTSFFTGKMKNTSMKDLSKDSVWFIRFQLLIEILIRLEKTEEAKKDIINICRQEYKDNPRAQAKINDFEKEVDNVSRAIHWYTTDSFLVHLLNKVCGTENVDDLYRFRLFIRNLHKQIVELNDDRLRNEAKEKKGILYRGKCMDASTFENFRKSIHGLVAITGFFSTTADEKVARMFGGDGISQPESVCVLFKLNIDNWKKCKPSVVIEAQDGAMQDEKEILFSIGSIWRISKVHDKPEAGMWCIELTSCQEENARSIELTNYLKEQLGETSNLWTLGDFLMKMGEYDKAEQYYTIMENTLNLPEQHADRAIIYNRLGLIRLEQGELRLAVDYFKKAAEAAPLDSNIRTTTEYNRKLAQNDLKRAPVLFLQKRRVPSDVISKFLAANEISTPIVENNLGYAAYHERKYDIAITHYQKAISIMIQSELSYLLELSCVYNNLGSVEYDKGDYPKAKGYYENAVYTIQQLNSKHPWIVEYKENLAYTQQKIVKKRRVE